MSKSIICNQNKFFVNFAANISVHVLFLFTILSILFIKIISKLETKTINDELSNIISDSVEDNYNKLNLDEKIAINEGIKHIDFQNIINLYNREDVTRKLNNDGIYKLIYITIALLVVILLLILLISKKLCNNVPISYILKENIIIFTGVGIVEYLFFKHVILNYIPVKPSFIMEYMSKKIKSVF
jgi:hypothetical protein